MKSCFLSTAVLVLGLSCSLASYGVSLDFQTTITYDSMEAYKLNGEREANTSSDYQNCFAQYENSTDNLLGTQDAFTGNIDANSDIETANTQYLDNSFVMYTEGNEGSYGFLIGFPNQDPNSSDPEEENKYNFYKEHAITDMFLILSENLQSADASISAALFDANGNQTAQCVFSGHATVNVRRH